MTKRVKAANRRRDNRVKAQVKKRDKLRLKLYGVTHLGYAIYGDAYDPALHGTPY